MGLLVFLWVLSGLSCLFFDSIPKGLMFIGISVLIGMETMTENIIKYLKRR